MTNEEMQAKYEALTSIEDAYALMQEAGYSGTMEDFMALSAKAAEEIGPMDMDAMDAVAGGFGFDDIKNGAVAAYEYTVDGLSKGWNWVKENPALTAEIGGSVVLAAIGVTYAVKQYRKPKPLTLADVDDEEPVRVVKRPAPTSWGDIDLQVNGVPMNLQ